MSRTIRNWSGRFGPAVLVTAAFIGPGTVTTASVAGARFGYALLWAIAFSVLAAIVLQEMSARLGLVTRLGLGEALRTTFTRKGPRVAVGVLVVGAIAIGNGAYQMGNITGASLGLEALTCVPQRFGAVAFGVAAAMLLGLGAYLTIERLLIALVALMSIVFVATAIWVRPSVAEVAIGTLWPSVPSGALLTVIGLIGTTVVPYNLFLHASSVCRKWPKEVPIERALRESRTDTMVAIIVGGIITLAITVTAAAIFDPGTVITGVTDMAAPLKPLLGSLANAFIATGLTAAGLTSAITAPLAAAYATSGVLGWGGDMKSWRFRGVWAVIVLVGTVLAGIGLKPVPAIVFAQVANGLILPVIAVFLLILMNRKDLLGEHRNRTASNVVGALVVLVAAGLGACNIVKLF